MKEEVREGCRKKTVTYREQRRVDHHPVFYDDDHPQQLKHNSRAKNSPPARITSTQDRMTDKRSKTRRTKSGIREIVERPERGAIAPHDDASHEHQQRPAERDRQQ